MTRFRNIMKYAKTPTYYEILQNSKILWNRTNFQHTMKYDQIPKCYEMLENVSGALISPGSPS